MSGISRRSFLQGSALFAAALSAARAGRAEADPQDPAPREKPSPSPSPSPEERRRGPKTDEEIFAEQEQKRQELVDDEGREYRICPQCGHRMYRQGQAWVCSNCGFSYIE